MPPETCELEPSEEFEPEPPEGVDGALTGALVTGGAVSEAPSWTGGAVSAAVGVGVVAGATGTAALATGAVAALAAGISGSAGPGNSAASAEEAASTAANPPISNIFLRRFI